jgi:hypothetical protein
MRWDDEVRQRRSRRRQLPRETPHPFTEQEDEQDPFTPTLPPRETAVLPALTLPARAVRGGRQTETSGQERRPSAARSQGRLPAAAHRSHLPTASGQHPTMGTVPVPMAPTPTAPARRNRVAAFSRVLIPGGSAQRLARRHLRASARTESRLGRWLAGHRMLLSAAVLLIVTVGILGSASGIGYEFGLLPAGGHWLVFGGAGPAPTPTPPPAPDFLDAGHYVNVYGFDYPSNIQPLPADESQRLVAMVPYALMATAAYDARYQARIEPELLLWWTHSEGIGARINYSNCANHSPRAGTNYFSNIENCSQANFWQLGYGNQFSVIYVLKNAFADLHGDPNNPQLVQKVGQGVLNYDLSQGTVPACGGYSCTFPALTIDQIMAGVNQTTGAVTDDNWWASVLSRDPAINCYMIAHALTFFNHAATAKWIGCYYAEPCWSNESDRLGDILAAWTSLRQAAGV